VDGAACGNRVPRDRGVSFGKLRLGGMPCRTFGMQHRMRRGEVVGQEIGAVHIDNSST
jgi:hypothetical protein